MKWSGTLSLYFGKQFLFWVLGTFLAIMCIVFLLDAIELLRRGSDKKLATLTLMLQMAALKAPQMGQTILPFATLFGATAGRLIRNGSSTRRVWCLRSICWFGL